MTRLSEAALEALPAEVERPGYDRAAVKTGVVHLGIGAFHRAHQAVVFDDALRSGDLRWGVLGASLRSPGVRDQTVIWPIASTPVASSNRFSRIWTFRRR